MCNFHMLLVYNVILNYFFFSISGKFTLKQSISTKNYQWAASLNWPFKVCCFFLILYFIAIQNEVILLIRKMQKVPYLFCMFMLKDYLKANR